MTGVDDEYERERQENIRKNQELLVSLGLHVSLTPAWRRSVLTSYLPVRPAMRLRATAQAALQGGRSDGQVGTR